MDYLNYLALIGESFLHPGGEYYSDILIQELHLNKSSRVLEIGCGTGATAVKLVKEKNICIAAVDVSEAMLKKAKERAAYKNVSSKITFTNINGDGLLPFADNSFDCIYSESVLGILNQHTLDTILTEVNRVLVKGGIFISNDAIWKDEVALSDIERINTMNLLDFGIIQSAYKPAFLNEWINCFEIKNLTLKKLITINSSNKYRVRKYLDYFRFKKRIAAFFDKKMRKEKTKINEKLRTNHKNDYSFLKNYIFVTINNKQ